MKTDLDFSSRPHYNEPPRRCPICNKPHEKQLSIPVDVTYCPQCGVPRFFDPSNRFRGDVPIECDHCGHCFRPDQGGGVEVTFRLYTEVRRYMTPRGFRRDVRLNIV
jgi:rubredoxin